MKVWVRAIYDIETMQLLDGDSYEYEGVVMKAKGASQADTQRQQELGMQQQAFNQQVMQLQSLQSKLSPYLTGNLGYQPQQYAAMQSQFLNNNAQQFQNAGQAVRAALLARGEGTGAQPVGGDYTRGISGLMGAAASSQAQGLLGLQQQNAQQALANQFNAAQILSGNAQTLTGTQGVAGSGASSALQSYIQAKNQGLMQQFMSGLGSGLGAMATGGLSTAAGGIAQSIMGAGRNIAGAVGSNPEAFVGMGASSGVPPSWVTSSG